MADHRPTPHAAGVEAVVIGFRADGGREEQHLRAHQRHDPCRFGIPLVPADADADSAVPRRPHLETRIAGAEIIFLLIARPIGNMALAIDAHDLARVIDHREAVIMMLAVALEEAGRDIDLQFLGQRLHCGDGGMLVQGQGAGEQRLVLDRAEIGAFEQFGRQDDLRPARGGLAHGVGHLFDILGHVLAKGELQGGDGHLGHGVIRGQRAFAGWCSGSCRRPPIWHPKPAAQGRGRGRRGRARRGSRRHWVRHTPAPPPPHWR